MRHFLAFFSLSLLITACTPDDLLRLFAPAPALQITLQADTADPAYSPQALTTAADMIARRLNIAGIDGAVSSGTDGEIRIAITGNPGDTNALIALVTRRGILEFADMRNAPPELLSNPDGSAISTSAHPTDTGYIDPVTNAPYLTVLDAVAVVEASATASQFSDSWDILLRFSPEHGAILGDYTAANTGMAMGIIVDGVLLSAPVIQARIGEEALIAGNFTEAEARGLAAVLGGGALPLPLTFAEIR